MVTGSVQSRHTQCLVCGDQNPVSLGLKFRASHGNRVSAIFQASRRLQGYDGVLHGGVISALLDAAMTHCLFHRKIEAVTADLHVRFLRPVPCISVLELQAQIVSEKPPLYQLHAELKCAEQVMARAEAKFMQRKICKYECNS
jgi:uncharacterized protein (TIGR00369 family)